MFFYSIYGLFGHDSLLARLCPFLFVRNDGFVRTKTSFADFQARAILFTLCTELRPGTGFVRIVQWYC
ncbi:MAG: hypothetical protein CL608_27620 [Anaerolineaceae bacterium]|nr:hypothetical protein [Anaerolineaceae bacterium]